MYAKLINNKLNYAPRNYNTGENLIVNFNKNTILLEKHGYKKIIDDKPSYNTSTHYLIIDSYLEKDDSINIIYRLEEIIKDTTPTLEDRILALEKFTSTLASDYNSI